MLGLQTGVLSIVVHSCHPSDTGDLPLTALLLHECWLGFIWIVAVVQSLSRVRLFATRWTAACQASLSFTMSWSLLKFMSIESVKLSNHLILCFPFSFCLQSFPGSRSFPISRHFTSGGQSTGASASASVLPMNIQDWSPLGWTDLDLLAVHGTLKRLLQHHNSKIPILWHSAFFIVQLSHLYVTTRKTAVLTIRT